MVRLINVSTKEVCHFVRPPPPYACASHIWQLGGLTLDKDLNHVTQRESAQKLDNFCRLAANDGLGWLWIDTVRTGDNSSAELSDSVNSMFEIFQKSAVCYIHLSDIRTVHKIGRSKWLRRCWTLQELIAPRKCEFFDSMWDRLGTRDSLADELSAATGICHKVLSRNNTCHHLSAEEKRRDVLCETCNMIPDIQHYLQTYSIAWRMCWGGRRRTARPEDNAYSLLGIFNVNMSLQYGEGIKSFRRLQEQLLRSTSDHSILAFRSEEPSVPDLTEEIQMYTPILATQPACFQDVIKVDWTQDPHSLSKMSYEDGDLSLELLLVSPTESPFGDVSDHYIGLLDCVIGSDLLSRPAIILKRLSGGRKYLRVGNGLLYQVNPHNPGLCLPIFSKPITDELRDTFLVRFDSSAAQRTKITLTNPVSYVSRQIREAWNFPPTRVILDQEGSQTKYQIARSYPERNGDYILPLPSDTAIGKVNLEGTNLESMLLLWGFQPHYPLGIWCKLLKHSTIVETALPQGGHIALSKIYSDEEGNGQWLRQVLGTNLSDEDCLTISSQTPTSISATISFLTYLDRHSLELRLRFSSLDDDNLGSDPQA